MPETSIIIDYLDRHHRGPVRFVPEDPDRAREVRLWDRIYDLYVQGPMQRIVVDRLRPEGAEGRRSASPRRGTLLATALGMVERACRRQALGDGRRFHPGRLRRGAGASSTPTR